MAQGKGISSRIKAIVFAVIALIGVALEQHYTGSGPTVPVSSTERTPGNPVASAYASRQSGIWMTVNGTVRNTLPDDNEGSRHQRFILRLDDGATVLVAHNIDLARHVPLSTGDRVQLRGRYEWNARGGVLHWTHHDPGGRKQGGWIEHRNLKYQ